MMAGPYKLLTEELILCKTAATPLQWLHHPTSSIVHGWPSPCSNYLGKRFWTKVQHSIHRTFLWNTVSGHLTRETATTREQQRDKLWDTLLLPESRLGYCGVVTEAARRLEWSKSRNQGHYDISAGGGWRLTASSLSGHHLFLEGLLAIHC